MADETGDDPTTGDDPKTGDDTTTNDDADGQADESDGEGVPAGTVELLAYLDAQYGDRFDADRREKLRDRVGSLRTVGASVSEADLENGDEPAFTFAAYRGED
ncbi:MAG: hypothetical protein V5A49_00145 [Haloarcula sp.]